MQTNNDLGIVANVAEIPSLFKDVSTYFMHIIDMIYIISSNVITLSWLS